MVYPVLDSARSKFGCAPLLFVLCDSSVPGMELAELVLELELSRDGLELVLELTLAGLAELEEESWEL